MIHDMVNDPPHYTIGPAKCRACGEGIECIDITKHMDFCKGNALKYLWRSGLKGDAREDLLKARWYINQMLHDLGEPEDMEND